VRFAADCGFDGQALHDIECAVGEALANATEHGHREGAAGFEVVVRLSDGALIVEIQDSGAGFDRPEAHQAARPLSSAPRGFGIFLMRELMDEITYSEGGTRVRMIKRLPDA
jgi:serine/threonine-protein kinase RsbW